MSKQTAAALVALLVATGADAYTSCREGKTALSITPSSHPTSWTPSDPTKYGNASGIWASYQGDAFTINASSVLACLYWGGYAGTLDLANDPYTYYQCPGVSGWEEHGYPDDGSPCYPYHQSGSPSGIAPNDPAGTVIEYAQIPNTGDGVSLLEDSGNVVIRSSWLRFLHDDAVEDDWCRPNTVTVEDSLLDKVFMAFAFDLRSSQADSCPSLTRTWYIRDNIVDLNRFAHAYKERFGHGGVFKDDNSTSGEGGPKNINLADFSRNVVLLGPVAGSGQVQYPDPDWLTGPCEDNVYLWSGTTGAFNDMLATGGNAANRAGLPVGCITEVFRDAAGGETESQFLARQLAELDGMSYTDIWYGWTCSHFSTCQSGGGCGIGPELALVLPLLGVAWRRRARGRTLPSA